MSWTWPNHSFFFNQHKPTNKFVTMGELPYELCRNESKEGFLLVLKAIIIYLFFFCLLKVVVSLFLFLLCVWGWTIFPSHGSVITLCPSVRWSNPYKHNFKNMYAILPTRLKLFLLAWSESQKNSNSIDRWNIVLQNSRLCCVQEDISALVNALPPKLTFLSLTYIFYPKEAYVLFFPCNIFCRWNASVTMNFKKWTFYSFSDTSTINVVATAP